MYAFVGSAAGRPSLLRAGRPSATCVSRRGSNKADNVKDDKTLKDLAREAKDEAQDLGREAKSEAKGVSRDVKGELDNIAGEDIEDFTEKVKQQFNEFSDKLRNTDPEEFSDNFLQYGKVLVNNFTTGTLFQRGETYGAVQVLLALFILRGQGGIDLLAGLVVGPITLLLGAFLAGKAVIDLGWQQLSIWPKPVPSGELRTVGLYETVRHPMYSSVLLSSLGFSAVTTSPGRFVLTAALAYLFVRKIELEEKYLSEQYGSEYDEYKEAVPYKLIPKIY